MMFVKSIKLNRYLLKSKDASQTNTNVAFILGLFIILIMISCELPQGPQGEQGPEGAQGPPGAALSWEDAIAANQENVYLLGIIPSGLDYVVQVGTGWAISTTQIITNAHVDYGIYDLCRREDYKDPVNKIVAVKNGSFTGQDGTYELIDCSVHPKYNNFNPFSNDFAIFTTDSPLESYITPANSDILDTLNIGQVVGTLGFPGALNSLDKYQPIATFKDGIVSALRPFNQRTTPHSNNSNAVIQYNFNTTGGTSGSPVFNNDGSTFAIHNSGVSAIVKSVGNYYVRIGLGDLNFGIRIDQRSEVMNMPYQVKVSDFRMDDPTESSYLNPSRYRVTLDWNSSYDFDLWISFGGNHFITGWIDESRAYIYPFCVHHGDDTYYGPELATILQPTTEIKIYAINWSKSYTSFKTSAVTCEIGSSNGTIANIEYPPSGYEKFWLIGTLSPSGNFSLINELTDEDPVDAATGDTQSLLDNFNASYSEIKVLKLEK
jgi:V8-like Glu-specific endopeptidase